MAERLITAGAGALAAVIAVGTACYIAGIAPPYPWSLAAFNLCLLTALACALRFGRG